MNDTERDFNQKKNYIWCLRWPLCTRARTRMYRLSVCSRYVWLPRPLQVQLLDMCMNTVDRGCFESVLRYSLSMFMRICTEWSGSAGIAAGRPRVRSCTVLSPQHRLLLARARQTCCALLRTCASNAPSGMLYASGVATEVCVYPDSNGADGCGIVIVCLSCCDSAGWFATASGAQAPRHVDDPAQRGLLHAHGGRSRGRLCRPAAGSDGAQDCPGVGAPASEYRQSEHAASQGPRRTEHVRIACHIHNRAFTRSQAMDRACT